MRKTLNPALAGVSNHLSLAGGGGVSRPLSNSRMADRSETSDAVFESSRWDGLKAPAKFSKRSHVFVQGQVKNNMGAFRFRAVETSRLAFLGQNFLQILLNHSGSNWMSYFFILSSGQDQATKGHYTYSKHMSETCALLAIVFVARVLLAILPTRRIRGWWSSLNSIWVNLDTRSGQNQVKKGIFGKQRYVFDAKYIRESNAAICLSARGLELP